MAYLNDAGCWEFSTTPTPPYQGGELDSPNRKAVAGGRNDTSLFERSASLKGLDSFASFSHQGEKEVPAAQAKANELEKLKLRMLKLF